jgi:hypothetical protein
MKKHKLPRFLIVTSAFIVSGFPAHACQMGPQAKYDDPTAPGVVVVRARVIKYERTLDGDKRCDSATYRVIETVFGSPPDTIDASYCWKADGSSSTKDIGFEVEELGMVAGAEVLAGLTTMPPDKDTQIETVGKGSFRVLVPFCWGPLHVRLDKLTPENREKTEKAIKDGFARGKVAPK